MSDNVFGSKRYLAIALYMALATVTSLLMYTIPTGEVYLGLATLFLCGFFVYGPQSSFWALCPDLVGNTNIPAIMIGEKAADLIRRGLQGGAETIEVATAA